LDYIYYYLNFPFQKNKSNKKENNHKKYYCLYKNELLFVQKIRKSRFCNI